MSKAVEALAADADNPLTPRQIAFLSATERKFATTVVGFMRRHGWKVQRNGWVGVGNQHVKGFPDMVCVREDILFVELKTTTGKLKPAQEEWMDSIKAAGGHWELWRPRDWEALKARLK
jgi:hypothetical protein